MKLNRAYLTSFLMGFTSGVPLLVILTLIQAWLKDAEINLELIGILTGLSLPYSLKFFWAPWFDYLLPPFLGRRRGWLLITQIGLFISLIAFSYISVHNLFLVIVLGFSISFFSASQDVVVDAYRREDLKDEQLGIGSAYYQWGYRLAMLIVSGGGLILADVLGWAWVYRGVALLMLIGPITLIFSPEPKVEITPPTKVSRAYIDPLKDFFKRPSCLLFLFFIFFYKFGDQLVTSLNTAFFLDLGYTKLDIGIVVKGFASFYTLLGVAVGGYSVAKYGLYKCLLIFGLFQIVTTMGFALLSVLPVGFYNLAVIISIEHFGTGASTAAFVAFMAAITNKQYSATQYALLSALVSVPRAVLATPSGFLVSFFGWINFYILGMVLAIPGLIFLVLIYKKGFFKEDGNLKPYC